MKKRVVCTLALASLLVGALTACDNKKESYDYEIKVWAAEAANEITKSQAQAWADSIAEATKSEEDEDGVKIKVTVQAVGEADAASNMITDVDAGADIFCFAQDQLARLKSAGALSEIVDENLKAKIIAENDEAAVSAAMVGDALVAYPITADNGYFMYYDKSVFPDESVLDNLDSLIAHCEAAGKKIYFECESSAWYNASFFMALGCTSIWKTNKAGLFYDYEDNYNSANGKLALKEAYKLLSSPSFINSSKCTEAFTAGPDGIRSAAVCISGTWDYSNAQIALGENLGATDLPSLTVNGEEHHLGSFAGCKLLGVKPQTDPIKAAYANSLAQALSSKEAQIGRFNALGWGPANKEAQNTDEVKSNVAQIAIATQNQYAIPQGQYPGDWWTSAAAIFQSLKTSKGTDAEIAKILKTYNGTVDSYVNGEPDAE